MGRTKQGGSVLSFIIVGVVLLGALLGGVYWYRQAVASHDATEVATKPASPSESSDSTKNSGTKESSQSSDSSKTPSTPPASTPAQPQSSAPAQLPTTGPADTLAALVALGALSAAVVAYGQSRRILRSL